MSYSSEVLADTPLGYWRLGEASGLTMTDSSGNGHNGTYDSSFVNLGAPSLLVGDSDTAASLSGRGGVVAFGSWMSVNYMTAEAIIKPSSLSGTQEVISHDQIGGSGQPAWRIRLNGSKVEWLHWGTAGTTVAQGSTVLTTGSVYHLAMTFNGTTLVGYVNGAVDYSVAKTGTTLQPGTPLSVGVLGDGSSEPFHGVIDEAAFYGTALSASRIATHYSVARTVSVSGTLAATLPSLTSTTSGSYGPSGSVSATLPSLTTTAAGTYQLPGTSGDMSATLPSLAGDLEGSYALAGQLAATLPSLAGDLSGAAEVDAALAATLPSLTASLAGVMGDDFLIVTLPSLSGSLSGHVNPFVRVGTLKTNRGNGIRLNGSAVVEVDAPLEDDPPNLTTVPIHIITPTVPAPTLVNGRPQ